MSFDLSTPHGLKSFDSFMSTRTYVSGFVPTQSDTRVFKQFVTAPSNQFPHARRFFSTLSSYSTLERETFPNSQEGSVPIETVSGGSSSTRAELEARIEAQGQAVRAAKALDPSSEQTQAEINKLLALKAELAALGGASNKGGDKKPKAETADKAAPKSAKRSEPESQPQSTAESSTEGLSKSALKQQLKMQKRSDKKQGKGDDFKPEAVEMSSANPNQLKIDPGMTTLETLRALFEQGLEHAFPGALAHLRDVSLERKANVYQVNSALQLQSLRREMPSIPDGGPAAIARALCVSLPQNNVIQEISVTPQGFIVLRIGEHYLNDLLTTRAAAGVKPPSVKKMTVAVDFSSPNIAKEMHVGHLRSTIIGDTICRLFEFVGHDVKRINHVGDWGTQFGMLLCHLEDNYPNFLSEKQDIAMLTTLYKDSKKRFSEEPGFKERAQKRVVDLQTGDPKCRAMWSALCDMSRVEFNEIYTRLGVTLTEVGESFYNDQIPGVISMLQEKQLIKESDGALCIFTNELRPPLMVRKRDGGYGYDSTDMAAVHYRSQTLKAELMIYITDVGQAEHFEAIFDAAAMAGWVKRDQVRHLGFGLVQDSNGQRFRTRDGETVPLYKLLDEAVSRMAETLKERIASGRCPLTVEDVPNAAWVVGHASVKYFDLRQNPGTNYKFEYDKMLNDQGDTAVYLLYTRARINSILNKGEAEYGVSLKELKENAKSVLKLEHETEKALAFELLHFDDVIRATMRELLPNLICKYLSDICTAYSRWNNCCKVLGSNEMKSRLLLSYTTMVTIDACLSLLGIVPLDRI